MKGFEDGRVLMRRGGYVRLPRLLALNINKKL
jgi:hypothetical protein